MWCLYLNIEKKYSLVKKERYLKNNKDFMSKECSEGEVDLDYTFVVKYFAQNERFRIYGIFKW